MPTSKSRRRAPKKVSSPQAEGLRSTREAHSREIAEDYVEAIADLTESTGEARVTDLAVRLGVTHVTVNRTIARLQQAGYVTAQPYRAIFLTVSGKKLAADSKVRHDIVVRFLRAIGVPEAAAQRDAEGIEHHVSSETMAAMERQLRKIQG
jgi:DtxR family manganese transport transcriptional regulator